MGERRRPYAVETRGWGCGQGHEGSARTRTRRMQRRQLCRGPADLTVSGGAGELLDDVAEVVLVDVVDGRLRLVGRASSTGATTGTRRQLRSSNKFFSHLVGIGVRVSEKGFGDPVRGSV